MTQFLERAEEERRVADAINQIYRMTPYSPQLAPEKKIYRSKSEIERLHNRFVIIPRILIHHKVSTSRLVDVS